MLKFNIQNQIITRTDSFIPVGDSKNYLKAEFTFSEEWTGEITAIFGFNGTFYHALLDENNECTVPWEVIKPPFFTVSVFCGDLITANVVTVRTEKSGFINGEVPGTPSPTVWEQYHQKYVEELKKTLEKIPEKLPNPQKLTFTGAVEAEYDGSEAVTVDIPEGGGIGTENGATFTPSVSSDGTLSWTNDRGLANPEPVNIKGPQGEEGEKGDKGDKGDTGAQGEKGADGKAGYTPYITPQMYGAVGDGVADDTEAVKSAITNAANGTVYFPNGTYKITSTIEISNTLTLTGDKTRNAALSFENNSTLIVSQSNVTIENLIIRSSTASTHIVTIANENVKLINCELDGLCEITETTDTATGGVGIVLGELANGAVIKDCFIHNTKSSLIDGWHYGASTYTRLTRPALTNLLIENNKIVDTETSDGIAIIASDSIIRGNHIGGKWENCVCIHANSEYHCERVIFENNTIDVYELTRTTKAGYGVALRYADDNSHYCIDCKIINNYFNDCGASANGKQNVLIDLLSYNTLVSGNHCRGVFPSGGMSIYDRSGNSVICGNHIEIENTDQSIAGIYLEGSDSIVSENRIVNNSPNFYCIALNSTTSNNSVCNNTLYGYSGISLGNKNVARNNNITGTYSCIYVSGSECQIADNVMSGQTAGIILINSTNNITICNNKISTAVDTEGAIKVMGNNHVIKNNIVSGGKIRISTSVTEGSVYYIEGNDCGGLAISVPDLAVTVFANDNYNYTAVTNYANSKIIENGIAKQAASPTSTDSANVWGSEHDLVKKYNIVVEDTSVTPYQRYVLRSDNTWVLAYADDVAAAALLGGEW